MANESNIPKASKAVNIANTAAQVVEIGTGIATTLAGIQDSNQRAKFSQNLQLLTLSQQETLAKALNNANNETERLKILSNALTDMSKQRINNIELLVAEQEKNKRNQLITNAITIGALIIVSGVVIYLIAKRD